MYPYYDYNRPGAKVSQGNIDSFWRQGMMGGSKNLYEGIKASNGFKLSYDRWRGQAWNGNSGPPPVGVSCSALLGAAAATLRGLLTKSLLIAEPGANTPQQSEERPKYNTEDEVKC